MSAPVWRIISAIVLLWVLVCEPKQAMAQSQTYVHPVKAYENSVAEAKAAMLIDPAQALIKAEAAERYGSRLREPVRRSMAVAMAHWLQGEAYLRTNNPNKADLVIRKANEVASRLQAKSSFHADILLSLGLVDSSRGAVGNALRDYQQAFDIYRNASNSRGQARALVLIAMLYAQAMDQETAERYYKQALEIYNSDISLSVSIYNNRSLAFAQVGQYDQSLKQLKEALNLAKKLNSRGLINKININIARVHLGMGNLILADRSIKEASGLADLGDSGMRANLFATAAQSALQHGSLVKAHRLIISALAKVDPSSTDRSYIDVHQTAYDVFSAVGDTKLALVHLQALKRLDDSATKLATSTKTALMAARFDFANQELRISQLKADDLRRGILFERARLQTQRIVFVGASIAVVIVIGLLGFALFVVRRSRNRIRAANDDLAITNSALGKALAAKTEFLATTSHEIRTPLNGILGMTQVMLADARLAPEMRDRLDIVHGAGQTMRALVDDILDVAKMETGNLTIETAPFDLRATVSDLARMWEEQARARGLSFALDLVACPVMIMGDAARLRQIMFNLLSNALKFTRAGRVSLTVDVSDPRDNDVQDGGMLRVVVGDSGIGISADKLEEIFEAFRQADAGTTRQFGGTGLGLSICRNLARAMGGEVTVSSAEGKGAIFTLLIPLVHAAAVNDIAADTDQVIPATLVVDRNPITRAMFRTLLAPHAGTVVHALSVAEAVTCIAKGGIARVLIDNATLRASTDLHTDLIRIVDVAGPGVDTTLLWPAAPTAEIDALLATGVTRVVTKPVSGARLVAAMFSPAFIEKHGNLDLVSHAA